MLYRPKWANSRTVTLVMWTAGIDQTSGNPGTNQILSWNDNWNTIRRMFWSRGPLGSQQGQLGRRWNITQGGSPGIVVATALAEVAGTMDPTMTGRTRSDFSVDLLLADPYFYGVTQTQTLAYATPAVVNNLGEATVAEGKPSALNAWTAKLNGPLTSPVLTNSTLGISVTLAMTIASGHYVILDFLNYTAVDDGGNSQISLVSHAGARQWMVLGAGNNTLDLTSSNVADTGTCLLTWNPGYV
jgi:hypothetical protein